MRWLFLLLLLLIGCDDSRESTSLSSALYTASQPNLVVIVFDDYPMPDSMLLPRMPNIQALANAGANFRDAHASTPLCAPGRATILTGLNAIHHGVNCNLAFATEAFDASQTWAVPLVQAGYRNVLVGKYLNNLESVLRDGLVLPGWAHTAIQGEEAAYWNFGLFVNGDSAQVMYPQSDSTYLTDVLANIAVQQIYATPDSLPLALYFASAAPHDPNTPAPRHTATAANCKNIGLYKPPSWEYVDPNAPTWTIPLRRNVADNGVELTAWCRTMKAVDEAVGRIQDALAATGRLQNTVFVITSDNNNLIGEHSLKGKRYPWGTRIPLIINGPGIAPRVITERVDNTDIAPTIAELLGVPLSVQPDGVSLVPLLNGATTLGIDARLSALPYPGNGVPIWYGVTTTSSSPLGRWYLVDYPTTGECNLYDLSTDPWMLNNVCGDPAHAALVASLRQRLTELKQ